MISYSQLRSWRSLCEWLDGRWYKFAYYGTIEEARAKGELKILPFVHSACGRQARAALYADYKIQFISYQLLPAVNYWSDRRIKRHFGKEAFRTRGWRLVSDWESKIDFLEQIVLFDADPNTLPKNWLPALEARIAERERIKDLRAKEIARVEELRCKTKLERYLFGYCPHCSAPVVALMLDCIGCGRGYEEGLLAL